MATQLRRLPRLPRFPRRHGACTAAREESSRGSLAVHLCICICICVYTKKGGSWQIYGRAQIALMCTHASVCMCVHLIEHGQPTHMAGVVTRGW